MSGAEAVLAATSDQPLPHSQGEWGGQRFPDQALASSWERLPGPKLPVQPVCCVACRASGVPGGAVRLATASAAWQGCVQAQQGRADRGLGGAHGRRAGPAAGRRQRAGPRRCSCGPTAGRCRRDSQASARRCAGRLGGGPAARGQRRGRSLPAGPRGGLSTLFNWADRAKNPSARGRKSQGSRILLKPSTFCAGTRGLIEFICQVDAIGRAGARLQRLLRAPAGALPGRQRQDAESLQSLQPARRERQAVATLGRLPAMMHAQPLRQLVAAQAGEGLHRLLHGGQLAPRAARALACGGFEVLDARVHGNQSPSTATIANRPPFVKAFAEEIVRRILSRGQATPCVSTQGHPVIPDCPISQVNAIAPTMANDPYDARMRYRAGGAFARVTFTPRRPRIRPATAGSQRCLCRPGWRSVRRPRTDAAREPPSQEP